MTTCDRSTRFPFMVSLQVVIKSIIYNLPPAPKFHKHTTFQDSWLENGNLRWRHRFPRQKNSNHESWNVVCLCSWFENTSIVRFLSGDATFSVHVDSGTFSSSLPHTLFGTVVHKASLLNNETSLQKPLSKPLSTPSHSLVWNTVHLIGVWNVKRCRN